MDSVRFSLFLKSFKAGEVAAITGLSAPQQRDWRSKNYLPKGKGGWTTFRPEDLLKAWLLQTFSVRGIGPALSAKIAGALAVDTLWHALQRRKAYSGNADDVLSWLPPEKLRRRKEVLPEDWQAYAKNYGLDPAAAVDNIWLPKADWLARQIWKAKGGKLPVDEMHLPGRFFCWLPDGSHFLELSLDEALAKVAKKQQLDVGAILAVDLDHLAAQFIEKAGPICHVEIQEIAAGKAKDSRDEAEADLPATMELVAHGHLLEHEGRWT